MSTYTQWTVSAVKTIEYNNGITSWSAWATTATESANTHVDLLSETKKWFCDGVEQFDPLDWPDMSAPDGALKLMELAKRLAIRQFQLKQEGGE